MQMRRLLVPVMAVALVFAAIGCGSSGTLSKTQYKEQAGQIHEDVGTDLNAIFDQTNSINFEDPGDMQTLSVLVSNAVDTMNAGVGKLEKLVPPDVAKSFHQRLLDFYDSSLVTLETLERDTNYTVEALTTLTSLENLNLLNITDVSTPDQVLAATQQDLAMVRAKITELANTTAPPDLAAFQQQLIGDFQQFANLLEAMVPAIQSSDVATLETLASQATVLEGQISNSASLISDVFDRLGTEIDDMAAQGAHLQDELDSL